MRQIATTSKYRKDWELAKRRNLPIEELNDVIYKLANDFPLPKEKKDHAFFARELCRLSGMSYQTGLAVDIQKDR